MKYILFPFSLIYGTVVYLKDLFYRIFSSFRFSPKTPLICIGNISVGGSGKTPLGLFLVEKSKAKYKVGVLLRGYKSESKETRPLRVRESHEALEVGDEALLYKLRFKDEVEVAISPDRSEGIALLESLGVNYIIMDDGLQHLKVKPSRGICVIEVDDLDVINSPSILSLLPSGRIREWPSLTFRRSDTVVFSKKGAFVEKDEEKIDKCIKKYSLKKVRKVSILSKELYDAYNSETVLASSLGELTLVSTVARPKYVKQALSDLSIVLKKEFILPDHAAISEVKWREISLQSKTPIVFTEKDLIKVKSFIKGPNEAYVLKQVVMEIGEEI